VIGANDTVTAKPVTVSQQSETEAVIADGLSMSDRVVTTGFASLSDGTRVSVGKDEPPPVADLAPRRRTRGGRGDRDGGEGGRGREAREARDGQSAKDWQSEHRGRRGEHRQAERDQTGQTGLAAGSDQPGNAAKPQP
jgi:membrane fusion protein, multidrug efflux system